jgi:hypothetical protein
MNDLTLIRVNYDQAPALEQFKDYTIFQTMEWLKFVSHTQNAEPVVAVVKEGERSVGRFSGLIVRKCGLRILGSPFTGWTTSYMGFNLDSSVPRVKALLALYKFAFGDLDCVHVEIMDRNLRTSDFEEAQYRYRNVRGFEIDLSMDEETLFEAMEPACRRCIRKADKLGVKIEVAEDASFADEYYTQLEDVFSKQKLVPTYPIERVRSLIEHLLPTRQLLLVRAIDGGGNCIATGIFPAVNDCMYFWGGASWRRYQGLRPNEAIQWFAMRYWKARGITKYDMGGGGEYKRKYGGQEITVPWGRRSRYLVFDRLRDLGKALFLAKQRIHGLGKR